MFIFDIWCAQKGTGAGKTKIVLDAVQKHIENKGFTTNLCDLKNVVTYDCKKIAAYWLKYKRNKRQLLKCQSTWLEGKKTIPLSKVNQLATNSNRGRPRKMFFESSNRTKRRRIAEISKSNEIVASALRSATVLPEASSKVNIMEVVSLIIETNLSKHQYLTIRNFVNSKSLCDIFPSYEKVLKAKAFSYPEKITVSESGAEVDLQSLLDHTASQILKLQCEVINNIDNDSVKNLILIGKWGFDGSTGHSEYKQKVSNNNFNDSSLFVTSYVPLQLVTQSDDPKIIWKNPRPSSTRYCRPLRLQFEKETTQLALNEEKYFKEQINRLECTECLVSERNVQVEHRLQLTMVDGKICNALSGTSSAKCYICDAKPSQMNDLENCLKRSANSKFFEFGLSPLHSYIRFFEYFLHLSYRLDQKLWRISTAEGKKMVSERKSMIQAKFRDMLGLIVDKPRTGGSGTSNDGNTARTFFNNPEVSAQITGLDTNLIVRCGTLLQVISSGYKINVDNFQKYALETAKELLQKYPWYYLPPSVHKILIHSADIINYCLLSIGELSEEAAESRNKDIKMFRSQHTRKTSRIATNTDLINRLLLSSDPFITEQRDLPCKAKSKLMNSSIQLLED